MIRGETEATRQDCGSLGGMKPPHKPDSLHMCAVDTHQHRHRPSAQTSRTTSQSFHDNVIISCEIPLQGWCAHWSKLTKSNTVLCYDRKPEMHFFLIGLCLVTKPCLTLWLHGLQHARLPWPSLSPSMCSNSCPLSQWCHPTISSSCIGFCSTWFRYIYISPPSWAFHLHPHHRALIWAPCVI